MSEKAQSRLDCDGTEIVRGVLSEREVSAIRRALGDQSVRPGNRAMLNQPWCVALAMRLRARLSILQTLVATQCSLFEKNQSRNWLVAAHQDVMIPTTSELGRDIGEGLRLVCGTADELNRIVAIRCHIDDCGEHDGALRVKPGTHKLGVLRASEIAKKTHAIKWQTQVAQAGDALLMRPLTVHASSKSAGISRRRVLHFVFT